MDNALEAILSLIADRARALTRAAGAVVEVVDGDVMRYAAVAGSLHKVADMRLPREGSLSGLCVREGQPLYSEDTATDPRVDRAACARVGAGSMICVPLLRGREVAGVLKVVSEQPRGFAPDAIALLATLADVLAAAIVQARELADAQYASRHDALTALPNRRAFDDVLNGELDRHRRYDVALSLAMLDLDNFKRANDTYGHAEGDAALVAVGEILRRDLRTIDSAYRLGGDEFAIVMPSTAFEGACVPVLRVATAIRDAALGHGTIGISYGIVQAAGDTPGKLCERADAALYEQKRAKR